MRFGRRRGIGRRRGRVRRRRRRRRRRWRRRRRGRRRGGGGYALWKEGWLKVQTAKFTLCCSQSTDAQTGQRLGFLAVQVLAGEGKH